MSNQNKNDCWTERLREEWRAPALKKEQSKDVEFISRHSLNDYYDDTGHLSNKRSKYLKIKQEKILKSNMKSKKLYQGHSYESPINTVRMFLKSFIAIMLCIFKIFSLIFECLLNVSELTYVVIKNNWRKKVGQLATNDKFKSTTEMLIKICYATDWNNPNKVIFSLMAMVQAVNPNITLHSKIEKIVSKVFKSKSYIAHSHIFAEQFSGEYQGQSKGIEDIEKIWNKLITSDLGIGIAQIAIILVTIGIIPELEWSVSGIEIFSLRSAKSAISVKDIYKSGKMIIKSLITGISNYESTGNFEGFFSGESLEARISYALSLYQQVLIGNLSTYVEGMNNETYVGILERLKADTEKAMLNPKTNDRFFYKAYLDRINDTLSSMASIQMEQQTQEQAFGLLFFGNSSVGKSWFAIPMIKWLLQINNFQHDSTNIITYNTNSKYDDQVRNNTYGILLDDLANGKVGKGGSEVRRTNDIVISMINNVSQAAVKADLAEKGKVLMKPKIVVATTNNRGLNAAQESHNEASVRRRFKYEVEFVVKKEFCISGSTEIDGDKISAQFPGQQFPPVWEFVVYKCLITEKDKGDGKGYIMQKVLNTVGKDPKWHFEIEELMIFVKDESHRHFMRERKSLQLRQSTKCECCSSCFMPQELCKCNYKGHINVVQDLTSFFYGEDNTDDLLFISEQIERNNPQIVNMLRACATWRNCVMFTRVPWFIVKLWILCECDVAIFVSACVFSTIWIPISLFLMYEIRCMILSVLLSVFIFWYTKDMSYLMSVNTIVANSHNITFCRVWRNISERYHRQHFLKKMVYFSASLYAVMWIMKMSKFYLGQSIEAKTVEEEIEKTTEKSVWDYWRGITGNSAKGITSNMTTQQLVNRISANVVEIAVDTKNGKSKITNGFFVDKGYLVVPRHFFNNIESSAVWKINRGNGRVEKVRVDTGDYEGERQWVSFGNDSVLVRLTGVNHSRNIIECFSKNPNPQGYSFARMIHRKADSSLMNCGVKNLSRKKFQYQVGKEIYTGDGYIGTCEVVPQNGMCCSLVVVDMKQPEIVGFHIAGKSTCFDECSQYITQDMIHNAIATMDKVCAFSHINQDVYDAHISACTSKEIHPFCPTNEINDELAIDVLGSIGGTGPRKMNTVKTPYHDDVCKAFNIENSYGIPKSTAKIVDGELLSPWKNCIKEFEKSKNLMPYTLLARARKEIVAEFTQKLDQYEKAGGICRPLTIHEAVNGIDGIRGIDGQKMTTAAGIKFGKSKSAHLVSDSYPYVYKEYVYNSVEEARAQMKLRRRNVNSINSNLKDEPLKLSKVRDYRTRVFFSDELDMMILVGQYFTPVMAYMMQHPESAHSAIGLNAESYDWECVLNYLTRKGETTEATPEDGVALDFVAFDKALPENLMKMCWQIMIDVASQMPGYSLEDITIMKTIADEKTTPYIWFNGTLVQCNFTHTSGNGCTAQIGSIAGLVMLCVAFYSINDPENLKGMKALDFVRSIHLGDDCAATVIHKHMHNFNFITLQNTLKEYGIGITPPDKESVATEYQNIMEEDFLKRHFHYCTERDSYVGKLAEKSIYKSMLYFLPSKVETEKNQLGQSLGSALKEAALHGRETFNHFKSKVDYIAEKYDLNVINGDKDYDYYVIRWACDSGKRHTEYRLRDKPYLEKLCMEKKMTNTEQRKIFGRVLQDVEETTEETYTGHSGECVCEYVVDTKSIYFLTFVLIVLSCTIWKTKQVEIVSVSETDTEMSTVTYTAQSSVVEFDNVNLVFNCCRGSRCCKKCPRKVEEEEEDDLSSLGSGSTEKANNLSPVENDGSQNFPTDERDTPSGLYRPLCCGMDIIFDVLNYLCGRHVEE